MCGKCSNQLSTPMISCPRCWLGVLASIPGAAASFYMHHELVLPLHQWAPGATDPASSLVQTKKKKENNGILTN